jgi:hypothetical protein
MHFEAESASDYFHLSIHRHHNQSTPVIMPPSTSHGTFDAGRATVKGTLLRILGATTSQKPFEFTRSASSRKNIRAQIQTAQ